MELKALMIPMHPPFVQWLSPGSHWLVREEWTDHGVALYPGKLCFPESLEEIKTLNI